MKSKIFNLENKIKNTDVKEFTKFFKTLSEEDKEKTIQEIIKIISSQKSDLCCKSLNILGKISINDVLPAIIDSLEYISFSENDVKRICHGDSSSVEENQEFKDSLVENLIKLKNPASVNMLIDLYEEQKDPCKREIIIFVFNSIGSTTISEFNNIFEREIDTEKKIFIVKMLSEIEGENIPALLFNMYKDKNKEVKIEVINSLEKHSSVELVTFLIKALRERNSSVVKAAIRGLVKYLSDDNVKNQIIEEIKHASLRKREEIIKYLSNTGNENVIPILLEAMKEDRRAIKINILESFKNIKTVKYRSEVIKKLIEELGNDDIRWDALIALEYFSPPEAVPHLIKLLKEEDPESRKIAKHGESGWECRKIIIRILANTGKPEVVPVLISALDKTQYYNRLVKEQTWHILIEALATIASPETTDYLIKSMTSDGEPLCRIALAGIVKLGKEVVPTLIEAYKDKKRGNKKIILEALAELGDKKALSIIKQALSDKNDDIRKNAIIATGRMDHREKIPLLKKALKDSSPKVRKETISILATMYKDIDVSVFTDAIKDEDPEIRKAVCEILGKINSNEALENIKILLEDPSPEVREMAEKLMEIS